MGCKLVLYLRGEDICIQRGIKVAIAGIFCYCLTKREIIFLITTFGGSLLSRGRYFPDRAYNLEIFITTFDGSLLPRGAVKLYGYCLAQGHV